MATTRQATTIHFENEGHRQRSGALRQAIDPSLILSEMNFAVAQLGSGDYLMILVAIMAVVDAGSAGVIVVNADGRQGC